jgi:hypothetical protein
MATNIQRIKQAYQKAGFRVVHSDRGAVSLARKAPVVVVDSKGQPRLTRAAPAGDSGGEKTCKG